MKSIPRLLKERQVRKYAVKIKGKNILEVGCGKHSFKSFFPGNNFIASDVVLCDGIVRADLTCLPFKNNSFDVVLCFSVLEHVFDFKKAINEMNRVLNNEGELVLYVPFFYPLHDEPNDFWRFSRHSIELLLMDYFGEVSVVELGLWPVPFGFFCVASKKNDFGLEKSRG